jgi:hypothetical protein
MFSLSATGCRSASPLGHHPPVVFNEVPRQLTKGRAFAGVRARWRCV